MLPNADEVHVWLAWLNLNERELQAQFATLSPDEKKRAEAFYRRRDRDRFIAGRGLLRAILAHYVGQAPSAVQFSANAYGKPQLACCPAVALPLRFNMTHSRDLALYAVAYSREVGIDVEWIREEMNYQALAERFFSPQEAATLRTYPQDIRRQAFFACWTRKEAYVKARGQGLSLGLDTFEVSLACGGPPELVRCTAQAGKEEHWYVYGFTPALGYVAALAVQGDSWMPVWRSWSPDGTEQGPFRPGSLTPSTCPSAVQ